MKSLLRALRGCGWCNYARSCRLANRYNDEPDERDRDLGFRIWQEYL